MAPSGLFQPFGVAHGLALATVALVAVVLPLAARRLAWPRRRAIGVGIGVALLLQEALNVWMRIDAGWTSMVLLAPLHLCTLAVFLTAFVLFTRHRRVYEVVWFWAMGGTTQALLTPDVHRAFFDPFTTVFFVGHGLVIVGVVYATLALGLRPVPTSIVRAYGVTAVYAGVIFAVNLAFDTNFLYLMRKPSQPSILDHLGPWPWYLLGLAAVALASMVLWYLPFFFFADRSSRRAKP